jgi:hypothetical protein
VEPADFLPFDSLGKGNLSSLHWIDQVVLAMTRKVVGTILIGKRVAENPLLRVTSNCYPDWNYPLGL